MKVAVFSESPADDAAVRILVDAILGQQTEVIDLPRLQVRGWPSLRNSLRSILIELHYQTDTDGIVVVADSDDSPQHKVEHEQPSGIDSKCRLCFLRDLIEQTQTELKPRQGRGPIKTAVGIAVPAIEAWYLCGKDPNATEAAWFQSGLARHGRNYRNQLKRKVYGTDRLSRALHEQAEKEAQRLVGEIDQLERLFPAGFGALVRVLKSW